MKAESFDILCSNRSRVVQLQVAPRGLRTAKVVKVERAKMKAESFDSLCSNGSRVVQLQVAPRGLRTAKVVKVER